MSAVCVVTFCAKYKDGRPGEVAQRGRRSEELGSEGLEPCGGNQSYGLSSQNYKTVKNNSEMQANNVTS